MNIPAYEEPIVQDVSALLGKMSLASFGALALSSPLITYCDARSIQKSTKQAVLINLVRKRTRESITNTTTGTATATVYTTQDSSAFSSYKDRVYTGVPPSDVKFVRAMDVIQKNFLLTTATTFIAATSNMLSGTIHATQKATEKPSVIVGRTVNAIPTSTTAATTAPTAADVTASVTPVIYQGWPLIYKHVLPMFYDTIKTRCAVTLEQPSTILSFMWNFEGKLLPFFKGTASVALSLLMMRWLEPFLNGFWESVLFGPTNVFTPTRLASFTAVAALSKAFLMYPFLVAKRRAQVDVVPVNPSQSWIDVAYNFVVSEFKPFYEFLFPTRVAVQPKPHHAEAGDVRVANYPTRGTLPYYLYRAVYLPAQLADKLTEMVTDMWSGYGYFLISRIPVVILGGVFSYKIGHYFQNMNATQLASLTRLGYKNPSLFIALASAV